MKRKHQPVPRSGSTSGTGLDVLINIVNAMAQPGFAGILLERSHCLLPGTSLSV